MAIDPSNIPKELAGAKLGRDLRPVHREFLKGIRIDRRYAKALIEEYKLGIRREYELWDNDDLAKTLDRRFWEEGE